MNTNNKRLIIVGTGIQTPNQLTIESREWIRKADIVLHGVADPISLKVLHGLNLNLECLNNFYEKGRPLGQTYKLMVERILLAIEEYDIVCVALYGHPGAFVYSSHKAIEIARTKGVQTKMLPGVSSFDCMIADLGFDPSDNGCILVEATDLILHNRKIEPTFNLVIWQVGFIGELKYQSNGQYRNNINLLKEYLLNYYPGEHQVTFYVASQIPFCEPLIIKTKIMNLDEDQPPVISSLFVPAYKTKVVDKYFLEKFNFDKIDKKSWKN
jgi:uncharacterized protein YabN with tetrapyrrole methylase and pyrophosphatase domain